MCFKEYVQFCGEDTGLRREGVFKCVSWKDNCKTSTGGGCGPISVNMDTGGMNGHMVKEMSE